MWKNNDFYVLSKAYIDDFKTCVVDSNGLNKEGFCAIKSLLRIASSNKPERLHFFVVKYPQLIEALNYLCSLPLLSKGQLIAFTKHINNQNYVKACPLAKGALDEIKGLNSSYSFKQKDIEHSYFENDYQKIISSSAFRRLQNKTQLFVMDPEDYSRKRLTHSIEVSAIAEKIANSANIEKHIQTNKTNKDLSNLAKKNQDKVSLFYLRELSDCKAIAKTSGVLHDIGNPPFGHKGEDTISNFFSNKKTLSLLKKYIKNEELLTDLRRFDGNAQTLRIATKLLSFDNKEGASLTAGVLASIIKYPYQSNGNEKKIGYFYSEKDIIEDLTNHGVYQEKIRNPFAYLLEAADDLAYLISDLEDAMHKKIIQYSDFKCEMADSTDVEIKAFYNKLTNRLDGDRGYVSFEMVVKPLLFQFRENIISSINQYDPFNDIISQNVSVDYNILEKSQYFKLFETLKAIKNSVFKKAYDISRKEKIGDKYIKVILKTILPSLLRAEEKDLQKYCTGKKCYFKSPIELLPENLFFCYTREIKNTIDSEKISYLRCRLLIDYVSGMTDSHAKKIYKKIILSKHNPLRLFFGK